MAHSQPFIAKPEFQEPLNFPGRAGRRLAGQGHRRDGRSAGQIPLAAGVYLDSCVKCGACTDKCHYYLGTSDPKNMPVGRQGPAAQSLSPPLFHLCRQVFPEAGRRRRPDQRSSRRLVQLFPPVLAVPPLLGFSARTGSTLPRSRWRRARSWTASGSAEVLQRDHRQGLQDRQQPRPAGSRAGGYAGRPGRGRRRRNRRRGEIPARRQRCGHPAGHAVADFFANRMSMG